MVVDENVSYEVGEELRGQGYEVFSIFELVGMAVPWASLLSAFVDRTACHVDDDLVRPSLCGLQHYSECVRQVLSRN